MLNYLQIQNQGTSEEKQDDITATRQPPAKKKKVAINPDEIMASTYDLLKKKSEQTQPITQRMDECDSFGVFVSNKLRSYSNTTRPYVQHHISNILFSADRGEYEYAVN